MRTISDVYVQQKYTLRSLSYYNILLVRLYDNATFRRYEHFCVLQT